MNKELKPLTDMELSEIEKYRDENGFINVTGIKDFEVMKYIIELVDRKNELEYDEKSDYSEDFRDYI
ncbi:MAG: hypothetical protein IIX55_07530 [Muribaculaceae bacterium]|nr:hypothetical protein [Muribaculaceae bacterium]